MDSEQKPAQNNSDSLPSVPPNEPKPVGTPPREPATAQQLDDVEKQMTGFEKATLRWARAAVIMSGLAAIFVCLQWWEMYTGSKDTHDLAVAAGNQATQTTNLAGDTHNLAIAAKAQSDQTKTIADQAIVQANANSKLAQNAVDTLTNTKQSFRGEQRAWVGVQGIADSKGFTETQPWQITVVFFNSGRTPARNVRASGMYTTSPVPITGPSPQQIAMLRFHPVQSIPPQGYYRANIGNNVGAEVYAPEQISGQQTLISQFAQIKNKQLFLYYYGLLKYEDASGQSHETQFCTLLADPDTKEAGMCDGFNDLN